MHRPIVMTSLLSIALFGACIEEPEHSLLDPEESLTTSAVVSHPTGYCYGSDSPPTRREPVSGRYVQTKWCWNGNVDGLNGGLLFGGRNWAVCQRPLTHDIEWPNYPGWYVWTLGDPHGGVGGSWDWFPASRFSNNNDPGPIPGLANCSVYFP